MCQFRSASVIALYLLLYLLHLRSSVSGSRECPPLPNKSTKNVVIKCHSESGGTPFECGESLPLGHGTVVTFDCAAFFKSNQDLSFSSKREISCNNGKWLGFQYFQSFSCLPECGKLSKSSNYARPVQSSPQSRLPWEVSIQNGPWNCQGTIIPSLKGNASAILTSRECISTNFPNHIRVTIDEQDYAVKAIKTPDSEATNLAILLLQRPIQLGSTVLPACLPSEDEYGGVNLVSGTTGLSGNLRMTVVGANVEECSSEISRNRPMVDRSQFCAEAGAKLHKTSNFCSTFGRGFYAIENQLNPIYSIVGIQNGVLKRPNCNSKMGFTKIEYHMDWVTEILELEAEMEAEKVSPVIEEEIGFFMNKKGCPPIKISDQGFEIQCDGMVDCFKNYSPANTVARYSCKPHFQTSTGGSTEAKIQCRSGGSWTPLPAGFGCRLDCGNGSEGSDKAGFITEGFKSARGRWPWAAAIYVETPPHSGQFEFVCGATLISQTAIVTAGHCLAIPGTSRIRQKSQIQLHFGKFLRGFDKIEAETQIREVRSVHLHPHYNPLTLDSDISIAILSKPVTITNFVHPVCLPISGVEIEHNFGSLIGWGRLLDGSFPEEMQEARLPFVPYKTCQHSHPTFGQLVRPSTNYCAGYRNSTGACDGDSGSGIFYRDSTRVNKWVLGGLVSGGVANWKGGCSPGHYSVLTKVSNFKDWILDTLSDANSNER